MTPLFQVTGQLVNVFTTPIGERDGEKFGGDSKIQLLGDIAMKNGEIRKEMVTLKIEDPKLAENLSLGDTVIAPIGVFAQGGNITYYIPKGSQVVSEKV